jgi:hypothetical protein
VTPFSRVVVSARCVTIARIWHYKKDYETIQEQLLHDDSSTDNITDTSERKWSDGMATQEQQRTDSNNRATRSSFTSFVNPILDITWNIISSRRVFVARKGSSCFSVKACIPPPSRYGPRGHDGCPVKTIPTC